MIKIEEYELSGYKNIERAKLSFNNFNVLIGPNNSGKSNFIQSISFLNYFINSSTDELSEHFRFGFDRTHFGEIAPIQIVQDSVDYLVEGSIGFRLKISNSLTNRIFDYQLVIDWKAFALDITYWISKERLSVKEMGTPGKPSIIFDRDNEVVKYGSDFSKTSIFESVPESFSIVRLIKLIANKNHEEYLDAVMSLNAVIKSPIFYFSNTELLKPNNKERLNEFNGRTVAYDLEEEIIAIEENAENWEIFKSVIHAILNITDVQIYRLRTVENDDHKKEKELKFLRFNHLGAEKPVKMLSDGSILILAIIAKILTSEHDILFIEEPENSTHPKALVDLIAFFKSYSSEKQFILSSHSIAILNKSKMEDVITSCTLPNGGSEFFNVSSRKELKTRLKQSYVHFSDELFFGELNDESEFS